ncbi:MAG: pyridoxal phosphate-dependent aminotransferase [Eubacterium sp.]|nr:pyridoxal phosphate-dependent aminotransferase [Eubacterium sp.]
MSERNLDFDTVIDRRNTKSLKYDFAVKRGKPADILPLWVADMDFRTSSYIEDALKNAAEHGIFGYTETDDTYFEAVKGWMKSQYDWDVTNERHVIKTPGIVFALAAAVNCYSEKGDPVLICSPVYYPFSEVITDNGRRIVSSNLVETEDGSYRIDYEDFEKKIEENDIGLFLLCNPHNPGSKGWTREELEKIGDICLRHNVTVISDEIHADFEWERKHTVFASLSPEISDITVTCTSPTKTFNIAGLQISNIIITDNKLRYRFRKQVDAFGFSQANAAGIYACEAAYTHGQEWLKALKEYIYDNIKFTKSYIEKNLENVRAFKTEATYLIWLDFRGTGLSDEEIDRKIIHEAGLWLDSGSIFGESGKGFQRINAACPRSILQEALERLVKAFKSA